MFAHLPSLKALHVFEAAARLCSFNAAAEELCVTPGAISYQIKQLETALGVMLFYRRVRQLELTESGQRLYDSVHRLLRSLDQDLKDIVPTSSANILTISVSTYFVTRWLSPRLGKFLNEHPQLTIRLQHSVNDPDFTVEEVDLAIRWGDGIDKQIHTELLFELPMIAVCSPNLLESDIDPCEPAKLMNHVLLRDQPDLDYWQQWFKQAGVDFVDASQNRVIIDPNVRVQSAIDGQGLVLANTLLSADIDSGKLCEPFNVRLNGFGYYLLCARGAADNNSLRLFRNWLVQESEQYSQTQLSKKT